MTDKADFESKVSKGDVAGVVVAAPNRYGILEDYAGWADTVHKNKALMVMNCVASALGVIKSPGEWGADIAAGDAQSLGMPLNYGGPYLGFLCATKSLMRKIPGRIVGATKDKDGKRSFVLTLQAREQHIRREKATSNICSNQGLMALYVTVYMSLLGAEGLSEVNGLSCAGARYMADSLTKTGKVALKYPDKTYLNEFVVVTNFKVDDLIRKGVEQGMLCGVKLADNELLVAVTEMRTKEEMDRLVDLVSKM